MLLIIKEATGFA